MSFDLFAVAVPPGGDLDDAAEALAARRESGLPLGSPGERAVQRRAAIAAVALAADERLVSTEAEHGLARLADGEGLALEIGDDHALVRVAYDPRIEDSAPVFERVFRVLAAIVRETAWRPYDPQDVREVALDDDECRSTQELYESVLDQLHPNERTSRRFGAADTSPERSQR